MPPILLLRQLPSPQYSSICRTISIAFSQPLGVSLRQWGPKKEILRVVAQKRGLCFGQRNSDHLDVQLQVTRVPQTEHESRTLPFGIAQRIPTKGHLRPRSQWPGKRPLIGDSRIMYVSLLPYSASLLTMPRQTHLPCSNHLHAPLRYNSRKQTSPNPRKSPP